MSICIIPARGGSKRIPLKNVRLLRGHPVIWYPIQAALESGCFEEVMVSTDDKQIAKIAEESGAKVPFMRSITNSTDLAGTEDVVAEVLAEYGKRGETFEFGCCIYPTAALVGPGDLHAGKMDLVNSPDADCVVSVLGFDHPPQRAMTIDDNSWLLPANAQAIASGTQDLKRMYYDAGQWYWFRADKYRKGEPFLGSGRAKAFLLSVWHAQDVDNEYDWAMLEWKMGFNR